MCEQDGGQGVYLSEDFPNVMTLLFADDMVEGADMVGRLQHLINILENVCDTWGFKVNINKTKVVVFRNGGIVKGNEKFFFKGQELNIVSFYKYLGVIISSRLTWTLAQNTLAPHSLKSIGFIKGVARVCGGLEPDMQFELFNKMVRPMLTYGAEIWGFDVKRVIEDVEVKYCKWILCVPSAAPRAAVLHKRVWYVANQSKLCS